MTAGPRPRPAAAGVPAAVLFDIDGTLLHAASALHLAEMAGAFADVTGVALDVDVEGVDYRVGGRTVMGRTDRGVFDLMGQLADVDVGPIAGRLADRFADRYRQAVTADPSAVGRPVDGAGWLLERLGALGVPVALCTGNDHRVASVKLAAAGLAWPFEFHPYGGFGSVETDRSALAGRALDRLEVPSAAGVWLVGDTAADMTAARKVGALGVLVGTGAPVFDWQVADLFELAGRID